MAAILFAFLNSIPVLDAKDILHNISTHKEVSELLPELLSCGDFLENIEIPSMVIYKVGVVQM